MRKKKATPAAGTAAPGKGMEVSIKWFLILHFCLLVNSLSGVASKRAGFEKFLSFRWFCWYAVVLAIAVAFAFMWQQVLKHMSLTFAFTNKPVTIVYALLWSSLFFHEQITPRMIIGSAIILAGIVIGVSGNG